VIVLRQLVVNADDLGLTLGVNNGIFDAYDRGILTSVSLFANAPATADAIARVRSRPSLGVGVHLGLVDGTPMLPPNRVPTLVEDDGRCNRRGRTQRLRVYVEKALVRGLPISVHTGNKAKRCAD